MESFCLPATVFLVPGEEAMCGLLAVKQAAIVSIEGDSKLTRAQSR